MRAWLLLVAPALLILAAACDDGDTKSSPTPSPAAASPTAAASAPEAANATYLIEGKSVTLVAGKSDVPAAPGSASRVVTTLTDITATGDLDGDGKPDRAVILAYSGGGSGTFSYLAVLPGAGGAPVPAALLGDRIAVTKVAIAGGAVTVDYLTRPDTAPLAATPSVPASKAFTLSAGQLKPR